LEKLIFIFATFKMAASATTIKDLHILKQCYDPFSVSQCRFQEEPEICAGLHDKNVPSIQRLRMCYECRKTIENLPRGFCE
jgi:hypothetical protein